MAHDGPPIEEDNHDNGPAVLVCIPVHNGEDFLSRAIQSVLSQTHRNIKLAIFENSSTDLTPSICSDFAKSDHRVEIYPSSEILPALENFNRAWTHAAGTSAFFMLLAHDDYLSIDFVENCLQALRADENKLLACPNVRLVPDTSGQDLRFEPRLLSTRREGILSAKRLFFPASWFYGLYRTEAISTIREALQRYPEAWGSDRLVIQLLFIRGQITIVPKARIFVQVGSASPLKYMAKTRRKMLTDRIHYFSALWSQRGHLRLETCTSRLRYARLCWSTAGHDTTYSVERILLKKTS